MTSRRQVFKATTTTAAFLPFLLVTRQSSWALTPQQAASDYDTYASTYDTLDGGSAALALGLDEARKKLIQQAQGDVLEIGVGTGLNLAYYDWTRIKSLTLVDVSPGMLSECHEKYKALQQQQPSTTTLSSLPPVKFITADATQELVTRLGASSFDTAVDTFSLCVMGDPGARQCLQQLRDVVRESTGRLLLLENTRSDNPLLAAYQDVTAPTAAAVGGKGCVYNQNVGDMIARTNGLRIVQQESYATGLFRAFSVQRVA